MGWLSDAREREDAEALRSCVLAKEPNESPPGAETHSKLFVPHRAYALRTEA